MRKWEVALLVCASLIIRFPFPTLHSQEAIGQWRNCLDYSNGRHVAVAGSQVYVAAQGGLFCYDSDDNTLTPLSKGKGLNDVGIATIDYDATTRCLVVAYTNSNIDILCDGHVYNLSDIKRSDIPGDKGIHHVRFANRKAYLATGFGVVVVDLQRYEIRETWYLGADGTYIPVYDLAFTADSIYAATGDGLKQIGVGDPHPAVSDRWATDHRLDGITVNQLAVAGSHVVAAGYTFDPNLLYVFRFDANGAYALHSGYVKSLHTGGNLLAISIDGSVITYDTALNNLGERSTYQWGELEPNDAVYSDDGTLWVAHPWEGLVGQHADGGEELHCPDGPRSDDNVYRLVPFNYRMMLCPGGHATTYANTYLSPNLLTDRGGHWQSLDKRNGLLDGCFDLLDVAVNPLDTNEMVATIWATGVASIRDNQVVTLYTENNTGGALVPYRMGDYSRLNTGAVAFDRKGDLWVLNSHSTHALAVRRSDGSWESFSTLSMVSVPEVDKLVWDSVNDFKWFLGRSNVIYVHDGDSRMAQVNPNNGSKLSTESVTALVQDQNGSLWIGTNKGIKVIYDGYRAFQNGGRGEVSPVTCSNITITNGEFAEYLMAYESITAIAVDGANRKWVGTANGGIYLISANGLEQLEHFTASNSPLLSDKIVAIGIHERSGEIYIGTDRGLQVYRGTATYAVRNPLPDIHAFPNPVRPDYDGPIAIKGFTRNGIVHITDAAGHTVYSTTANGGQAIWNGRTLNGDRVASGVYYVFASDESGNNQSVTKILVIR